MASDMTPELQSSLKRQAAIHAVTFVESGMVVGLGHGSTAILAVQQLAAMLSRRQLSDVQGIPCSQATRAEALRLGIPLTTLEEHPVVDLTIDGADEVDPALNLIKGGGGALLWEKIVAQVSRREIIVVDVSKVSPALGTHWAVPVEVIPFGWRTQAAYLESLGARVHMRLTNEVQGGAGGGPDTGFGGHPFRTDQGNLILDCDFGPIGDPLDLGARLDVRAGIVAHGLFLGLVTDVIVASPSGLEHLRRGVPADVT